MRGRNWRISPRTVLRPESSGPLWFHRDSGELLELDPEGVQALQFFLQGRVGGPRRWFFLNYLYRRDFLRPVATSLQADLKQVADCQQVLLQPNRGYWSAPEALHLSLTDRCDQRCRGCFFSNPRPQAQADRFMSELVFQRILQEAAAHQVFQIALGGGEPLQHPRLLAMVTQIVTAGLVPSLTTNGNALTPELAQALRQAGLAQLQFSLNGLSTAVHSQTRPNHAGTLAAIACARQSGIRWGLNILVTRQNLNELESLLQFAQQQGAWSVNLLRPKAAQDDPDWLAAQATDPAENRSLQRLLQRWQRKALFLLTTDSSFAFLRRGALRHWQSAGVQGCGAGRQILSIGTDGRVAPCSHLPTLAETADSFMAVWHQSATLERFRMLETTLQGQCGTCELKSVCRGCRAIVLALTGSFEGEDPGCPKHRPISSWPSFSR